MPTYAPLQANNAGAGGDDGFGSTISLGACTAGSWIILVACRRGFAGAGPYIISDNISGGVGWVLIYSAENEDPGPGQLVNVFMKRAVGGETTFTMGDPPGSNGVASAGVVEYDMGGASLVDFGSATNTVPTASPTQLWTMPTVTPQAGQRVLLFPTTWKNISSYVPPDPPTYAVVLDSGQTFFGNRWRLTSWAKMIEPSSGSYGGETIDTGGFDSRGTVGLIYMTLGPAPASAAINGPGLFVEYFANDPATFGPAAYQGLVHDAVKIGWSWYSRFPANAFFTLRANSIHNARLSPLLTHIRITYYNPRTGYSVPVFAGRLSEPDYSGEDVIWTAWNYLSELSLSRTGYRTMYPGKKLGSEIAAVEWALAKAEVFSLQGFITTGTIQDPLGSDNVTVIVTDNRFGVIDVPRLLLMYDLTEIGRANTIHNVTMGISRASPYTFTFLKDAGVKQLGHRFYFPGNVRGFRYVPGYASLRNDLATIGTGADGMANEIVRTDEVSAGLYGRRQDVFTIKTLAGQVGGATESDSQQAITARAVKEATSLGKQLLLDVRPELVEPFDGWDIEDTIRVQVLRGSVNIDADYRIIGARGLLDEHGYHPQIYVTVPTT